MNKGFLFLIGMIISFVMHTNVSAQSTLCASKATSFCCEYVSSVSINGQVRNTSNTGFSSGPGYQDFSGTSITNLVAGSTIPISVTVQANASYQEFVKMWIDFNGNGNLEDAGELVFNSDFTFSGTKVFSGNVTVPSTAFNGTVYMRIVMTYSLSPTLCGNYSFGNTLDFKAKITGGVTPRLLTVTRSGTSIGNVVSTPAGINTAVGSNSSNFADGSSVTLTASNVAGGTFINYTGDITSTNSISSVTMDADKNVTTNFCTIPNVIATPASQTICSGSTINTIVLSGNTAGATYNWTRDNTASVSGIAASGSGDISGSLTNTTNAPITVTFTITPTANGCLGTPVTATVTVNPKPTVNAVPNQVLCNGSATTAVTFTGAVSAPPGTVYNWTNTQTSIGLAASGSGNFASFTATNTTAAPVVATIMVTPSYTNGGTTCNGTPISFTITVNPTPTATATPASQTVCSATPITTIAITGNAVSGVVYNWTRDNTGTVTGMAATGAGNISGTLTNTTNVPITVTFTITPTANGCAGTPVTATVLVNPKPTVNAVSNQVLCNGATTAVTFTGAVSAPPGTVYNWTNSAASIGLAASGSGNIASFTTTNATAAPVVATTQITPSYTNGGTTCNGTPISFTITVNPTPTAIATPASQTVCSATPITTIAITGNVVSGVVYNWTRDNVATVTGIAASGAGNISGTLTNITTSLITVTFTIIPTANGCAGTPITVTVVVNPTPTVNQPGNQVLCNGSPTALVSFIPPATGGKVLIVNNDFGNPGWPQDVQAKLVATAAFTTVDLFDIQTGTPTLAQLQAYNAVLLYTNGASISNTTLLGNNLAAYVDGGGGVVTMVFTNASIPIGGAFNTATYQVIVPASQTQGSTQTLGTVLLPAHPTMAGVTSFNGGTQSYRSTSSTLAPGGYRVADWSDGRFLITAKDNAGAGGNKKRVDLGFFPVSNTLPGFGFWLPATDGAIIMKNALQYVGAIGNGISYSWTNNAASIGLTATGTGNIPSFNATNADTAPVVATIVVTPTYTNGGVSCNGTTKNFTITVNPTPNATATPAAQTICSGSAITTIVNSGTVLGTVFNWTRDNGIVTGIATSNTGNISGSLTNPGNTPITVTFTITPTYTTTGVTCSGTPITATVVVNPVPTVNAVSNQVLCNGAATTAVTFTGAVSALPGTVYNWTNSAASIGLAASGSGNIASFTATNATATPVMATIQVTPSYINGGTTCNGTPISFTITINPTPTAVATPASQTVCSATPITTIAITGNTVSGVVYNWTRNNTGTVTSIAASGAGNISGTLTNTTTSPITVTFTITPTANGCAGTPITATMLVNPTPTVNAVSNQVLCNGAATTAVTFTEAVSAPPGTVYNWTNSAASIGLAASGSGNIASFTATNATAAPVVATIQVTPSYINGGTTCNGTPISFTITVNPTPTATASSNSPVCAGTTLSFSASGGTSYAWTGVSFSSILQNPNITTATSAATGTYQVIVTNASGCTATATTFATVNPVVVIPTPQANTQIIFGASITLTATGCSGENDVLKWYQSTDNALAVMPVSPPSTANYYVKCETMMNGITCKSVQSTDVIVTVLAPTPPVATGATNCLVTPTTLTATGCSGSVGTFVSKWYQNADNVLVTMPVSPLVSTDYYAKCEQTFNSVTAISAKSTVVTLTVLNPIAPVATNATVYAGNNTTLTATGCTGTGFTLKWYQTADNVLVIMPISPTVTTQYYAKCEQTANAVTCPSSKSNDATLRVVNRIFVDISKIATPIQNGNSWATAYGNLQTALAAATANMEIWVAKGIYKPTITTTRTIYFEIPTDVKVYGGFAGTENTLNDRNITTNVSILSGDIGIPNLSTDNSYHVVVLSGSSNTTLLDGFTITRGSANFNPKINSYSAVNNPNSPAQSEASVETGGGILVSNGGNPIIANCSIVANNAIFGGGICCVGGSTPTINACIISNNESTFGSAMYAQNASHFTMNNVLIAANKGIGGIYNNTSNPTLTNCTIASNGGYNGGIFNSQSQSNVKNSILWGNVGPFNDTQSIITYSIVQGGYSGIGNLAIDPQFVNPAAFGPAPNTTGDYHLKGTSLAIDRGDNGPVSLTDKDLDGNTRRFAGGRVDMGAYEFQGTGTSTLIISVVTGLWEANSTWDLGRVPQLGDYVIIDNNHIVILSTTGIAKSLEYRGTGSLKSNAVTSKLKLGF